MNENYIKKLEDENKKLTDELQKYKDKYGLLNPIVEFDSKENVSWGFNASPNINSITGVAIGPLNGAGTLTCSPNNNIVFNGDSIEFKSANIVLPQTALDKKVDIILNYLKPKKPKYKRYTTLMIRKLKRKFK